MRKFFLSLMLCCALLTGCSTPEKSEDTHILASMYPIYVAAANITQGVQGVHLELLAPATAGCLHDYQMTTADRTRVQDADIVLINGLGMETFLDKMLDGKTVVDTSRGYDAIPYAHEDHDHDEHEGHDHDHGEINPHIWTSPDGAIWQAIHIRDALCEADPKNAQAYVDNAQVYLDALMDLQSNMHTSLAPYAGTKVAVLHDSLAYFAREFDLEIVSVLKDDPDAQLSAKEITEAAASIRENGAAAILSELQYENSPAAQTLARETGLAVYDLDTAVTGDEANLNAYLEAMDYNTVYLATAWGH